MGKFPGEDGAAAGSGVRKKKKFEEDGMVFWQIRRKNHQMNTWNLWQNRESDLPFAQQVGSFLFMLDALFSEVILLVMSWKHRAFFTTVTDKREHVRECDQSTTQMHVLCRDIFEHCWRFREFLGAISCVFWRSNSESHDSDICLSVCFPPFVRRDFPHFAHSEGAQLRWNAATSSVNWGIVRFIMWCYHAHSSVVGRILEFTSFSGYEPRAHVHTNNCRFWYRLVFNVRHVLCILLLR